MANIKIIAGPFPLGTASYSSGIIYFPKDMGAGEAVNSVSVRDIRFVTVLSRKKIKRSGWNIVGFVFLGPFVWLIHIFAKLLAEITGRGVKTEITFSAELKDGREIIAVTDKKIYEEVVMASSNDLDTESF